MTRGCTVCGHPLVEEKLARLRDKSTPPERFRSLLEEAGAILGVYALSGLNTRSALIRTPLGSVTARVPDQPVVLVAVLRAGLGMVDGLRRLVPDAAIGHIGLYRDEKTLNPVRYYVRLPKNLERCSVVLCDPMLATGGSAIEAIRILKTDGAQRIIFLSLLAAQQGLRRVRKEHPDVPVVVAGVDPSLNRHGYIVPGLGDAGDRMFGTV